MYNDDISINPAIMMGKPCIAGTRITVELIIEKLAYGESFEQILEGYPRLTRKDIQSALAFVAKSLRSNTVYPIRKYISMIGKPVVVGTNITVDFILDSLANGKIYEQIIEENQSLTHKTILAVLIFAVRIFSRLYKPKLSKALIDISRYRLQDRFTVITKDKVRIK